MSDTVRFLVLDGYAREGREDLKAGGASTAGELYSGMLKKCSPGSETDIIYPGDPDAALPQGTDLTQYDGIAWTGSSLTIHQPDPKVTPQIEFAREAFKAGVPSFGSCWAAQIAVVAAGGACAVNPRGREMGVARKIELTPAGRAHPMYIGKRNVFDAYISHDDEITHLPEGGILLASNAYTHVQAVTVNHDGGVFWGLQYHPEYDLHELARLCYCRKQKLTDKGFFTNIDDAQKFVDNLEALFLDPSRKDISWILGLDEDVMNDDLRRVEVKNWIEQLVIPKKAARS